MIFVTVGTHEQQFDRLLVKIDEMKKDNIIKDEVFIQSGYSNYEPQYCNFKKLIGYKEMDEYVRKSSIIITHGGPGSIFLPIQYGKIPIVVPRNPRFDEHVDEHQIKFTKKMEENNRVLAVYNISELVDKILNYENIVSTMSVNESNNLDSFVKRLDEISIDLID